MDRPIKIGLVGCGRATLSLHLPALRNVPAVEVVALADPAGEALARAGSLAPGARLFADYRQLLELTSLDAVAVCVPAAAHAETGLAALEAGHHLFIEKPLALTLADCDRLITGAARSGRTVMVGFNTRHHRLVRQARDLLRQEGIGAVELVRSSLTSWHETLPAWRQTRATGGGVLFELGSHHYDVWRFLTGGEVKEVSAFSRSGPCDDEAATVIARLSDGVVAAGSFSQRTGQNNTIEVCGRQGRIGMSLYRFDGLECTDLATIPGNGRSRLAAARNLLRRLPAGIAAMRRGGEWAESYRSEWQEFAAAVRGGRPAAASLADGRQALAVALAAAESASTGRTVRLPSQAA